jgi:hypothetical protein
MSELYRLLHSYYYYSVVSKVCQAVFSRLIRMLYTKVLNLPYIEDSIELEIS